ncbi:MAG TPA: acyl-ACP--UDP-N-acetylglucosamine O-acyltransferase [Bacteroidia bacterium]|jgi:UDP-N-acetylglucosamine acyltransferase|nr:acyl-ACP--UDP-N-acetylglucosamine O-acyltransferase [Bacteroidia bacterium]
MISTLAQIHKNAEIGENVTIDAFAVIHDNVKIGAGTHIESHAVIYPGARIGKNCRIFPGAVISAVPQDLKFAGEDTTVEIGDNTVIREYCTIHRGTKENWKTVIGNNCLIMNYVHVAHDCVIGNHVILSGYSGLAGHVDIEDYVIMEGYSMVQQFIRIGAHAFLGGSSKVRKNVPPYVKASRDPLSYIGVNTVGLSRRGFKPETIKQIEDIYRLLYVMGTSIPTALKTIEAELPNTAERQNILDFINNSPNGIMKGPLSSLKESDAVEN